MLDALLDSPEFSQKDYPESSVKALIRKFSQKKPEPKKFYEVAYKSSIERHTTKDGWIKCSDEELKKIEDTNKFIIAGILGMLLFQQIQNIGMTIGILPITGITLPFISYGGSSLLSYMLLVGIIINISMRKNRTYNYK